MIFENVVIVIIGFLVACLLFRLGLSDRRSYKKAAQELKNAKSDVSKQLQKYIMDNSKDYPASLVTASAILVLIIIYVIHWAIH